MIVGYIYSSLWYADLSCRQSNSILYEEQTMEPTRESIQRWASHVYAQVANRVNIEQDMRIVCGLSKPSFVLCTLTTIHDTFLVMTRRSWREIGMCAKPTWSPKKAFQVDLVVFKINASCIYGRYRTQMLPRSCIVITELHIDLTLNWVKYYSANMKLSEGPCWEPWRFGELRRSTSLERTSKSKLGY